VFKRNSIRFVAALLAVLASLGAGSNAALDAAPQHRDQACLGSRAQGGECVSVVAGGIYRSIEWQVVVLPDNKPGNLSS